jgi:hypothetical protein
MAENRTVLPEQILTAGIDDFCVISGLRETQVTSRSANKTRMGQVTEALIALSPYSMASPSPMSPLAPSPWANLLKLTHVIPPPSLSLKRGLTRLFPERPISLC